MRKRYPWIKLVMWIVYGFMFLPICIVVLMSFNKSQYGTFPFEFSLKWYEALFSGSDLGKATGMSLWFSLVVALAAIVIGILLALAMRRLGKRPAAMLQNLLNTAIIIPWLVLGIAMLILFHELGGARTYFGMFLGNTVVVLPYVVLLVYPALMDMKPNCESAARMLGARPLRVFFTVTLREILPAVAAGGLMALMVCFNNFVMQYYLAPFGVRTLPLEIYNLVRVGYQPDINALATIMVLASVALVLVVSRLGFTKKKGLFW